MKRITIPIVVVPIFAMMLSGCATLPQPSGDQWAHFGESTRAGPVVVRPDALVEDSRCPMNARCVWAGRVVITATLWTDGKRSTAQLISGEPFRIAGGELVLNSVRPESFMTNERPIRGDYVLHFSYR